MAAASTLLRSITCVVALLIASTVAAEQKAFEPKTFDKFIAEHKKQRLDGYFPILIDNDDGKVYLEIPTGRGQFIFNDSLPQGIGSNDIGLDRGQLGTERLVVFERVGKRVLLRQLNTRYRGVTQSDAERASIEEAFASSVLWGFNVAFSDDRRTIIDYTPFLLTDIHKVIQSLKETEQGEFKLDADRSAPYWPRTKAFPKNVELEATLTYASPAPGREVQSVTPEPGSVTVHSHHSLIELPPPGYEPRVFHPYSGFWSYDYFDYAQPIEQSLQRRFISRHRLQKQDPNAARSEAVQPLVYYVDPGTPEPIRTALLEGASWWSRAFEAIGFVNAFQVKMLPPDADPMDVRYNVIQWVHRSTRGWSYGSSVIDPRTGEIIKGHVTLESLRVRQDLMIAQGLLSPFDSDTSDTTPLTRMALARLHQLAAHEVGHTLGIAHNFAASMSDRGSVMDYPHPRIGLSADGKPTLDDPYGVGLGAWDMFVIAYGYSEFPHGEAAQSLAALITRAQASGLRYLTDVDSRSPESFSASGNLWDDGTDILAGLKHIMDVRKASLARFGAGTIRRGTPWSELANVLVPIYYLPRYQIEATARLVGGVDFGYSVKGEQAVPLNEPVKATTQQQAINALLDAISPQTLSLDPKLIALVPPPAFAYGATRESPPQRAGGAFDPVTLAEAAGEQVLSLLLAPGRLARQQQQHALNAAIPGNTELFRQLLDRTVRATPQLSGLPFEIRQRLDVLVVEHLLGLGYSDDAVPETQAAARVAVRDLRAWLTAKANGHYAFLADMIGKAIDDGKFIRRKNVAQMPPGEPI
jgi:hypothetical protein